MRKTTLSFIFIFVFAVLGCSATASPTQPTVESSATAFPTLTPSPLPTATEPPATSTLTPEPGLRTNGPYFAYFREVPGWYAFQFVMMDADGGGRKVVDLPQGFVDSLTNQQFGLDMKFVSPNGKWLAFYTGYAGEFRGGSTQSIFDLTLNLLNLNTGETQVIIPLLSKDYPDNFAKAINEINDSDIRPNDLQTAFLAGITQALAWSPDGRYLAFAGQMEGLSSDLYLYDMSTKKIQRLSNDNEELQSILWSPDGKWILHESGFSIDLMAEDNISVVAVGNSSVRDLGNAWRSYWLNSHEILEYRYGIEQYQLRLVDVDTGKITEVWKGYFNGYEVDPTGNWIVLEAISSVVPPEEEEPGFIYGSTQLINLKSLEKIQNPAPPLSGPPDLFLRAKDGTVVIPRRIEMILASPDTKYWAVAIKQDIKIYTQDLTLVMEISVPLQDPKLDEQWRPDDMQWNLDSSGLFLVYGTNIYFVNISKGEINLVEANLPYGYRLASGWISGQ